MDQSEHVIITLRSLPRKQFASPPINRLRRLLKACLRQYGFRCEHITPAEVRESVIAIRDDDDEQRHSGSAA